MGIIKISEVLNGPWKERAIYVCEERAIPSVIDGLKPSQRFLLTQGYKTAKTKFEKVVAIAGAISALGFHHGNSSAESALIAMTAYHSNNLPLFEGDGNFGNVLNPAAAAPRYIFARLQKWIDKLFLDNELCPKHDDPEILIPKYYLPIIPLVLVNGIKGIATGYACNIPAHDPISIIDSLISKAKTNKFSDIEIKLPHFNGFIGKSEQQYVITGIYKSLSSTKIHITEIPWGYTMESYEAILEKLVDSGKIVSYENNSRLDKFDFVVTLKRGCKWSAEQTIKNLKLTTTLTPNITTITEHGKLKEWSSDTGIMDIMNYFYDFRIKFIEQRIQNKILYLTEYIQYLNSFIIFCEDVIKKKFDFHINETQFNDVLINKYKTPVKYVNKIINAPIKSFTTKVLETAKDELSKNKIELDYFKNTTPEQEYIKDLNELKKAILNGD